MAAWAAVGLWLASPAASETPSVPGSAPSASGNVPADAVQLPAVDGLWDYGRPDSSEARFLKVLPLARASGDLDYQAQLLTQIARAQGLQAKFEESHRTLDQADSLIGPEMVKARLRSLLERGRAFNSAARPDTAQSFFLRAWELATRSREDFLAVDAAHMLGIVAPPEQAIEWNLRAMELAEGSADPKARSWLGSLYNNLGWTYHDRGDFRTALEIFRKGYDWRREQDPQSAETRIAKWTVARALRSLGLFDDALARQTELVQEWQTAGEEDGYVFEEMGECLLALGRDEDARPWFARAHAALSRDPWLVEHEGARLERMASLGGVAPAAGEARPVGKDPVPAGEEK